MQMGEMDNPDTTTNNSSSRAQMITIIELNRSANSHAQEIQPSMHVKARMATTENSKKR